ncbi:cell envelope protein SmpA [alpha proteobacterium AAP81b]|nr:cell envelope protein SmpA [alpha proteobacterium AAP81b]
MARRQESVMRKALAAGLIGVAALSAGCSQVRSSQGYLIDETLLTSIQPGVDNRESVGKTLGRPTFAAQFDDREWYYVSRNTAQYAFLSPKVTSQSILVVSFDEKGNVAKVERRGPEQIARISPVSDKTETLGRKSSFFEDLFGNLGQVGTVGGVGGSGPTGRDGPR